MQKNWNSRGALLMVGAILLLLNLIGLNLFVRVDLTDDKVYSLSDASIELVQTLDDPVIFKAFFTEDLPAPYNSIYRYLKDKLDDYRSYGGQNVQYEFVDPGNDDELRQEASRYQIPPLQVQVVENDNVQIKNAYMGLAIQYGTEREVIPVVQDISRLEYDITSALKKLVEPTAVKVGFLSGHGEPTIFRDMGNFQQLLARNYDVTTVTVADSALSERPDVLVVVAPTDSLPPNHLRALDDYIMGGGRVGFLLNRVAAELQQGTAYAQATGLEDLLQRYGMGLVTNLVMDMNSSALTVQRNMGGFPVQQMIRYPFLPIATNFNPDNIMVNRLREVRLFFASAIDTTLALPEGVQFQPLMTSSAQSSTQEGFFFIQPNPQPPPMTDGPFLLGAAYTGTFPSAYQAGLTSVDTRLVLVGDGDFLNESLTQGPIRENIEFGLNMVDWLAQDDALLAIRSKSVAPRYLDAVSDGAKPWIKYVNMLGPALLILLFGLIRWNARKNRQIVLKTT